MLLSLRLKRRSGGAPLAQATLAATLVVAALMLAVFPAAAEAQTSAPTEDKNPSVVVRPGDSLWSISQGRLGPDATPQRVADAAERIHALNRGLIGADPDLIFVGQELSLPPVMMSPGRPIEVVEAAQEAAPRDRAAEDKTGNEATAKAPRTAAGGADARGGDVSAPVAERQTERQAERQAEPVSLPDQAAVEPVPAVRTLASNDSSPSSVLRTIRTEFTSAASWLADSFAGARTDGRRLLGLGVLVLTVVVAALVAWKLPMRRTTREDAERWGIPTRYYGARLDYRNIPIASRPGSPGDFGREEARQEETPVTLAPEQRGVPTGNGLTPVANGARNAAATTSVTAAAEAAHRVRGPKARARAKAKASPRNGLALGAHNPGVRSASLLARTPARAPARARKPRPPSRAARPPLVSAPNRKRRGEQR